MKKVINNTFLKLIFTLLEDYKHSQWSPSLPERMGIEKVAKLVANLPDEKEYVIHIKNLKQVLNHK